MDISATDLKKFKSLLDTIKISVEELDLFMSTTPHIYRNIKGHAFEIWFDREMKERGVNVSTVGGDDIVDRVINGKTLQLKTPYIKSVLPGKMFGYRMHKTHGAEIKPDCYYTKEEFADFLVGLHPSNGVVICPRKNLPTRGEINKRLDYPSYLADPLPFPWDSEWINRYDLLGLKIQDPPITGEHTKAEAKLFPMLINRIGFTDYDIVHSILDEKNFRTWFQLIVGSIREFHFANFCRKHNINLNPPTKLGTRGAQKVDTVLESGTRIQVKGLTKGMTNEELFGCETQSSHGRIPNRLYKRSDFDLLVIVIDPGSVSEEIAKQKGISSTDYNFVIVPIKFLPRHPRSKEWREEYVKSSFYFKPEQVEYNQFELLV